MDFIYGMVGSSWLEWFGAATGFIAVVLTVRRSLWSYLFGIPCVVVYTYLFWTWQLYSQTLLYAYYIPMLFYGLYAWFRRRDSDGRVLIERTSGGEAAVLAALVVVCVPALGWVMDTQTDARFPYLDAATTVIAGAAQYLQSRRRVATYYVWALVNVLSMWLFFQTGNAPTLVLYGIYLALSVWGMIAWTRAWRGGVASPFAA